MEILFAIVFLIVIGYVLFWGLAYFFIAPWAFYENFKDLSPKEQKNLLFAILFFVLLFAALCSLWFGVPTNE
jgi:hypothetical protein